MTKATLRKYILIGTAVLASFAVGAFAANKYGKSASVIHVVTLYWKDGTTAEQKQAVWTATEKMAADCKGIKNIWLKSIKVQGQIGDKKVENAFVIEFADAQALKDYANDPAHKAWEKVYLPVRGESRTFDITN